MEIQFTPWRMAYIKGDTKPEPHACVLCSIHQADPSEDERNYLLYRGTTCYVVLNIYPYNTGHLMVVPYAHTADLANLDDACAAELFSLTRRTAGILQAVYQPQGMNLGMNLGQAAGAGIAEHMHMHVLPRWGGDTNFMPLLGGTKLIPETLADTYARLRPSFAALG